MSVEHVTGSVWWHVKYNGIVIDSFTRKKDAIEFVSKHKHLVS